MELAIIGSNGSGTKHGSNDMRRMALAPKQWIVANSHLVSSATMLVRCRFGILTITQVGVCLRFRTHPGSSRRC